MKTAKRQTLVVREATQRMRVLQTEIPSYPLGDALRVPRAIAEHFGLRPSRPLLVAQGMEMQPTSGHFRMLCGAAIAYGLTEGGYNASEVSLTSLGRRIFSPMSEGDDESAKREAVLKPRVLREFLQRYDGARVPR